MLVDLKDQKLQKCAMNRREFFSSLAKAAGVLTLGPPLDVFGSEIPSSRKREALLAQRRDLYQIQALSEQALLHTYTQLLKNALHFADRDWKTSLLVPEAGYWGDGVSSGNGGIRTVASMVLACGALLKYDDDLTVDEHWNLAEKAKSALRYAIATHVTGMQKCTDGKPWGATEKFGSESWQSGMWTGTLAFGVWLIWDKLDLTAQQGFQRVIAWEDDILSRRQPPNGLWQDTKAEENGWEIASLVLGELMFPSHPNASAWHEAAVKYMMNTLCTEADTRNTTSIDGRPVNQWVGGANLQPDFTLENHNIFHPSYVGCSCYFLTQAAMYYTFAGRQIPQAATHHLMETWQMFQTIILPWGEVAYPQGMDWELHGLPFLNLYASLATHQKDPFAACMEQKSLQYMREWQEMGQGNLAIPGSPFGITRHAINAEQAAYGFLAHNVFGPAAKAMTASDAAQEIQGAREFPYLNFVVHRTRKKFASFSWKNKIMGVLIPIADGHENNPNFTVPIANGFVGSFELDPGSDSKTTVVEHSWNKMPDGFETSGTLLLNGGKLKQTSRILSIGDQILIYEDRVMALDDVTVRSELGMPIGIENDELTGGSRIVFHRDGQTTFDWKHPRQPINLSGSWTNVDGRLGVVMVAGGGLAYAQATGYSRGMSVYSDILYGSYSNQTRQFKAAEQVAYRAAIFSVEVTREETMALARSCRVEEKHGSPVLHFKQPGKKGVEIPLMGRVQI